MPIGDNMKSIKQKKKKKKKNNVNLFAAIFHEQKMLLTAFAGHTVFMVPTGRHPIRHLEYFETLNDDKVSSLAFIKVNV